MKGTSPSRVNRTVAQYGIQVPRWEVRSLINSLICRTGKSMADIVTIGIDLAKNVFAVHSVDATGKPRLLCPSVPRAKLPELIAALPPCLIGMEACSGAHHGAREFQKFGHTVRLMAPKFVAPYRLSGKRGKNNAGAVSARANLCLCTPCGTALPPTWCSQAPTHRARVTGPLGREHDHDLHPCAQGGCRGRCQPAGCVGPVALTL
jgi:hypothetical protein